MRERRKLTIIDNMINGNSILVGLSLLLLGFFIMFLSNTFGLKTTIEASSLYDQYLSFLNQQRIDIFIIILIPVIGASIELAYREKNVVRRDRSLVYMGFLVILFLIMIYPKVTDGHIHYVFDGVLLFGISFYIDLLGYTILLITSFVWFYVIVYAHEYMTKERHTTRFFFFLALTYAAVLGAIMSGDLLTMFLFFEIMTFSSYMLVIHGQNEAAYKSGYNYLVMGLIGGLMIFTAILLIYFNVGSLSFNYAIVQLNQLGGVRYWIIGLLVFGFGIKAGMAPVHVWLPRAHPVAPTPASAILSGVMIKVGAFGIIRTVSSYFYPTKSLAVFNPQIWATTQNVGALMIWIGIFTMLLGMFFALQEANIKKLLAYSSISQMGYIVMGIGVAMYLGGKGAMGYTGAIYHIINHAFFKSLLFMVAGVVYFHTKELNMYKLGGIWKKLPVTTMVFVIGMLGIIGMPLFNGYVSKTILHHAVVEAYEYGSNAFILAEILFIIASIGTAAYFTKMFYYVFIKENKQEYKELTFDFSSLDLALLSVSLIIVLIGVNPRFIIDVFIMPQFDELAYSSDFIQHYIEPLQVFKFYDIAMSIGIIGLGVGVFFLLKRRKMLTLKWPKWLTFEYIIFLPSYLLMKNLCSLLYGKRCPYNAEELKILNSEDTNKVGFIDRLVVTINVINRRYERQLIRSDAFIYVTILTLIFIIFMIQALS